MKADGYSTVNKSKKHLNMIELILVVFRAIPGYKGDILC